MELFIRNSLETFKDESPSMLLEHFTTSPEDKVMFQKIWLKALKLDSAFTGKDAFDYDRNIHNVETFSTELVKLLASENSTLCEGLNDLEKDVTYLQSIKKDQYQNYRHNIISSLLTKLTSNLNTIQSHNNNEWKLLLTHTTDTMKLHHNQNVYLYNYILNKITIKYDKSTSTNTTTSNYSPLHSCLNLIIRRMNGLIQVSLDQFHTIQSLYHPFQPSSFYTNNHTCTSMNIREYEISLSSTKLYELREYLNKATSVGYYNMLPLLLQVNPIHSYNTNTTTTSSTQRSTTDKNKDNKDIHIARSDPIILPLSIFNPTSIVFEYPAVSSLSAYMGLELYQFILQNTLLLQIWCTQLIAFAHYTLSSSSTSQLYLYNWNNCTQQLYIRQYDLRLLWGYIDIISHNHLYSQGINSTTMTSSTSSSSTKSSLNLYEDIPKLIHTILSFILLLSRTIYLSTSITTSKTATTTTTNTTTKSTESDIRSPTPSNTKNKISISKKETRIIQQMTYYIQEGCRLDIEFTELLQHSTLINLKESPISKKDGRYNDMKHTDKGMKKTCIIHIDSHTVNTRDDFDNTIASYDIYDISSPSHENINVSSYQRAPVLQIHTHNQGKILLDISTSYTNTNTAATNSSYTSGSGVTSSSNDMSSRVYYEYEIMIIIIPSVLISKTNTIIPTKSTYINDISKLKNISKRIEGKANESSSKDISGNTDMPSDPTTHESKDYVNHTYTNTDTDTDNTHTTNTEHNTSKSLLPSIQDSLEFLELICYLEQAYKTNQYSLLMYSQYLNVQRMLHIPDRNQLNHIIDRWNTILNKGI